MQSVDSTETHAYGTNKNLVCKKEEIVTIMQNLTI